MAPSIYTVRGKVANANGVAGDNIRVIAYSRKISADTALTDAIVGKDGSYELSFPESADFINGPDLQLHAVNMVTGEVLSKSDVRYNASTEETIHVLLPEQSAPGVSEFQSVVNDLVPHMTGIPFSALTETDDNPQLTYLSNKTGWDARIIAMVARSHQFGEANGIPPDHAYAFYRMGVASEDISVYSLSTDTMRNMLEHASGQSLINPGPVEGTVATLDAQSHNVLLNTIPPTAVSSMSHMLDLRMSPSQKNVFVDALRTSNNDMDMFWRYLETVGFSHDTVDGLKLDAKMGALTGHNQPLIQQLYATNPMTTDSDIAVHGYYRAEAWMPLASAYTPPGTTAEAYSEVMAAKVRLSYPNVVAGQMLRSGELDLGGGTPHEEMADFLAANHTIHTIGEEPVKNWHGFDTLSEAGQISLKKMERLYQISPSDEAMVTLSAGGISSAYDVVNYTQDEFVAAYGPSMGEDTAAKTYLKANQVFSGALSVATAYLTQQTLPNVYVLTGTVAKQPNPLVAYPTLDELFGSMDYCACEECRSVLSPAAYLVELLQLIDMQSIPHDLNNPLSELLLRRPDIQHIQLTCENTNLAQPYVDLVNEILEYYIVNSNLTNLKGHDNTEFTRQIDLLAEPQFVNATAYNSLLTKVYPYNLPFHQPLETLRWLFKMWDTTLEDGLALFFSALGSRKETLTLNDDEYRALTDSASIFHPLGDYFKVPGSPNIAALNTAIANAKIFSARIGVTYEELVQLLKTTFLNPAYTLVPLFQNLGITFANLQAYTGTAGSWTTLSALITPGLDPAPYGGVIKTWIDNNRTLLLKLITLTDTTPGSECSFTDLELRFADPTAYALDELAYHKFHRFMRLKMKTGWSIELLDKIITVLTPILSQNYTLGNIDATFITLLARMANFKKIADHLGLREKKYSNLLDIYDTSLAVNIRTEACARLVKLTPDDRLELATITGIDPMLNDLEVDNPSMTKFIRVTEALKEVSIKVADVAWLLHHRDDSGKLNPPDDLLLKNVKLLRDALNTVEKENSIAPDTADYAIAKAKMALVYDAVIAEQFFGFVMGSNTYSASFNTIEQALPAPLTTADSHVGFDSFNKVLTYQGVVSPAAKAALEAAANALTLASMTAITSAPALATYITDFKAALLNIYNDGNADLTNFGNEYPELKTLYDNVLLQASPSGKAGLIVSTILPGLKTKLKTNALRQALPGVLKTTPETVNVLTDRKEVIHASASSSESVLYDFTQLEAAVNFNANGTYNFYLDLPATDDYVFYVQAPQNTVITLSSGTTTLISAVIVGASGEVRNATFVPFKAGTLTPFTLTVASLPATKSATIAWRTKGIAKTPVPSTAMYLKTSVDFAKTSLVRLYKSVQLQSVTKLTPVELDYFSAVNIETTGLLNDMPTAIGISNPALVALWAKFFLVAQFVGIKKANEPETDTWVSILKNPSVLNVQGNFLLESICTWQTADLNSILGTYSYVRADLSKISVLKKVMTAMDFITSVGYAASQTLTWVTANPSTTLVASIKATVKASVTDDAWVSSLQTVSDPVRNLLRDALVNYVLNYVTALPAGINTPNKLYEYFLVDVEMDACLKTSRIRLALSSVQLFIQRCLLNLETNVAPSSIRVKQWTWMQRYRVWEANRKVFLYPENWLEPELRDEKSSLFRELEGDLMQSEITDESAENAFLAYLKKLDDIARLEIVATFLQENEANNQNDDILHVFGRSNGNTRKYYHRRYEYGYWTPWEKIDLNIEGDLIFPVMWKHQLFLFWLSHHEKPAPINTSQTPTDVSTAPTSSNTRINVEITMSYAEFFNGKWSSPKSSDMNEPIRMNNLWSFNRNTILLYARTFKEPQRTEKLIFNLTYMGVDNFQIFGNSPTHFTITYTTKNAPPVITAGADTELLFYTGLANHSLYRAPYASTRLNFNRIGIPGKDLKLGIAQPDNSPAVNELLLTKKSFMYDDLSVLPIRHKTESVFRDPFVYNDERSTMIVVPSERTFVQLWQVDTYYPTDITHIDNPSVTAMSKSAVPGWPPQERVQAGVPLGNAQGFETGAVAQNPNLNRALPTGGAFNFDGVTYVAGIKSPSSL